VGRGATQSIGERRLQVDIGYATDPIRAEETGQTALLAAGQIDGDGDGDGAFATVTVIWAGLMATTLMPGGTVMLRLTMYVPTSRVPTDAVAVRVDVSKALRAAVAPPRVTITLGVERV
jgi:hypothetical protein